MAETLPSRGGRKRRSSKAASASAIPLLLAAVLQPAGESVIAWSASDASLQGWESRGQCPPLVTVRMSSLNPCGAGWETLACMHEGSARSVSRVPVPKNEDVVRLDDVGEDEGQDTGGYSLREGYYLAILVRLGLIVLEFGSRPLKNAKRILSCGIICFALFHMQSPDAGKGLRPRQGSSKDMFAMSIGLRISGKGRGSHLSEGQGALQRGRQSSDANDGEVPSSEVGGNSTAEGQVLGGSEGEEPAANASNRGTLTFASIYLVSKLLNKLLCLTRLDKKHKKMRLIKLTKLAKIGKIAYNPLSKRSVKMAVKMCRYLKLLKLLKLSKKSKKLVAKRHWRKFKVLKALKLVKVLQLMGVAYALS